ncbi:MAG: sulfatase-like hydrolase/transferase, partial [Gammaproteobacteria bacterium]|nr:sulfatase-like hydrolase/transferase [Gammaproteobacteria bacterium]
MRYAILMVLALGLAGCGGGGEGQTATAPTTPVVSNAAPTGALTIVGTLQVGSVLSVSSTVADADGLGVFSYQWYRNTTVISGATSATYQLQAADLGAAITVKVSYVDGKNNSEQLSSAPSALVVAMPVVQTKPNILLIIADDFGLDAFSQSAYGQSAHKALTPNLDALAKTGIVFDNLWATPACTTTRGSLITGQHGVHSGISFVPAVMDPTTMTLQRYLRSQSSSAGYQNAVIGKWHLGGASPSNTHPNDSGVDYYAGNLSGVLPSYTNWSLVEQGISSNSTEYHTTKVTNLALDWIAKQQAEPWFLWLAFAAPHTPFHLPPAALHSRTDLSGTEADIAGRPRDYYLAAVEAMDTEIGRLLNSMDANTRANTVIMFIGDNGTPVQVVDSAVFSSTHVKNSLYEGGIRVPMIVSGKGVDRANEHEAALINTTDFFATIATLAGNTLATIDDSYSFAALLKAPGTAARTVNYAEFESATVQGWVVRDTQYKLHQNLNGSQLLFDISTDINEQIDLLQSAQDYSAVVSRLKAAGDAVRAVNSGAQDITDKTFVNRSSNCADYAASYQSRVKDVLNNTEFDGALTVAVSGDKCQFHSNAIPNHHFNDGDRSFPNKVSAQDDHYEVPRNPQPAATVTGLSLQTDNAILLNGVKVDLLAAGCYGVGNGKIGCNDMATAWRYDPMHKANGFDVDSHNAHAQPDGTYHYHGTPNAFYPAVASDQASPVVGFAADGYPIYGPYVQQGETVKKVSSSYRLKAGNRPSGTGQPGGSYDGQFRDDYEYVAGLGDLDECNGMNYQGV